MKLDNMQVFVHVLLVRAGKGGQFLMLLDKGFDHTDSGQAFLYLVRKRGEGLLLGSVTLFDFLAEIIATDRDCQQRDNGQQRKL